MLVAQPTPRRHGQHRVASLSQHAEELDRFGAQVTGPRVRQIARDVVQRAPEQHSVLRDNKKAFKLAVDKVLLYYDLHM